MDARVVDGGDDLADLRRAQMLLDGQQGHQDVASPSTMAGRARAWSRLVEETRSVIGRRSEVLVLQRVVVLVRECDLLGGTDDRLPRGTRRTAGLGIGS